MNKAGAFRYAGGMGRLPLLLCPVSLILLFVWGAMPLVAADTSQQVGVTDRLFRLAFSSGMFTDIKVEDARAAMKVWLVTIMRERNIPVDPEPKIYANLEEMLQKPQGGPVEGYGVTTEECWRLSREIKIDRLVVGVNSGQISEEYVILVHRDSGIESVPDLRGRFLIALENPRMSLARIWLDTLLAQAGLNPASKFFSQVTSVNKLSQVVLPVFFRKSDACLVTRRGFQTMSELNPQVGKQLRVLATSPELVPIVFAFRSDNASPYREQMLIEMRGLPDSPAGHQILTLLQSDRIEEKPLSCLDGAYELLTTHQRLSSAASSVHAKTDAPGSGQSKSGMRGR